MTKPPKRPRDTNQLAKHIVDIATGFLTAPPQGEAVENPAGDTPGSEDLIG
jgi:hypothetical protein